MPVHFSYSTNVSQDDERYGVLQYQIVPALDFVLTRGAENLTDLTVSDEATVISLAVRAWRETKATANQPSRS